MKKGKGMFLKPLGLMNKNYDVNVFRSFSPNQGVLTINPIIFPSVDLNQRKLSNEFSLISQKTQYSPLSRKKFKDISNKPTKVPGNLRSKSSQQKIVNQPFSNSKEEVGFQINRVQFIRQPRGHNKNLSKSMNDTSYCTPENNRVRNSNSFGFANTNKTNEELFSQRRKKEFEGELQ